MYIFCGEFILILPFFFLILRDDLGFRLISEQVSHHPPISAFHAEGLNNDFIFHGSIYPKLKFWGKSVEAEPKGTITLELLEWVGIIPFTLSLCTYSLVYTYTCTQTWPCLKARENEAAFIRYKFPTSCKRIWEMWQQPWLISLGMCKQFNLIHDGGFV